MARLCDPEIGYRTSELVREKAGARGIEKELDRLGIDRSVERNWRKGYSPSALSLSWLALGGYDIMYILTGQRRGT